MDWAIGILIDVILLLVVVICAKKGSKDGFAKTLVSFFGVFIALVVAAIACTPVAEFCYDSAISKTVETKTQAVLDDKLGDSGSSEKNVIIAAVEGAIDGLPEFIKKAINTEKITEDLKTNLGSVGIVDTEEISHTVNQNIIRPSLIKFFAAIFFVLIFLILYIVCKLLAKSLKLVNKIPLLGKLNSLLGGILGVLKGIIVVIIVNWIMVYLVGESGSLFGIITMNTINSSLINNTLTKINPLNMVFSNIF